MSTSVTVAPADASLLEVGWIINDGRVDWVIIQISGSTLTVRRLRWYERLRPWLGRLSRHVVINLHWWQS